MAPHGDLGIPVGTPFRTRQDVYEAGIHRHTQAGIAGTQPAAESIVISGGYADDLDLGDEVWYTGYGGRDANSGRQVSDQDLKSWNWALTRNRDLGIPVRVIRGADPSNPFAPRTGYRYDGLYDVIDFSPVEGRDGYRIFHYHLIRRPGQSDPWNPPLESDDSPPRVVYEATRVVRDPALTLAIKEMYGYRCQISGTELHTPTGPYAEAAHIKPLGRPHDGPDALSNLLCLCPNDHIRFDRGSLVLSDGLEVVAASSGETIGDLAVDEDHWLDPELVGYHRFVWTELLTR